jgi:UDP-N-acetylmuramate--alanine ligase
MRQELMEAFAKGMAPDDILLMPDIFYAGGSAQRDISSADLIGDLVAQGRTGQYLPTRDLVRDFIRAEMKPGDRVVVMGARDDTLTDFAKAILADAKALKP